MKKLKFGWAEVSITPDKKASLAGQFAERISEYVEKPITATAMAIESDGQQAILVSVDIVCVAYNLVKAIRDEISAKSTEIDPMKVIISATHPHTAPCYPRHNKVALASGRATSFRALIESELPPNKKYIESADISGNKDIISDDEMFDLLVERVAKAAVDAWNNRKEGSYSNAFGRAAVGMCRRATYSDGSAQMWGDTNTAVFEALEGGSDTGIELLYIFDENKKVTGVVANIACPAQCVQHRLFVSPDYWGEVKVLLREYFGEDLFVLALYSAAGDQCPVDLVRWVEPESDLNDPNCKRNNPPKRKADPSMFDLAGMKKAGKRVAREIIDVYEEGLDEAIDTAEFKHETHIMPLPLRRVTLAEVKEARREIQMYLQNKPGDVDFNDAAALQVHLGILRRAELQDYMNIMDTEVHIIKLGNIAFASNPFELFLDYGNQIRARSKAEQTFLIQLACDNAGYLPTEKAEKGGHYSAFVSSGTVGHIGGEQLVRQTLTEINKLF
ncbi:MAG: hypothetical protein IKY62_05675 [Clostridia bacterium]|nr:hypothetical protein [Clostridia bacterium]